MAPDARDAGKLLSALRPPQHVNGALGPLTFADAPVSAESVPRAAVDELRESGLLQPGFDVGTLRMPLGVRSMLASYAWLGMTTPIRKLHERLASEPIDTRPTEDQIEVHFHAVRAGDVERAKATARFYGTELRELATQLSLAANRNKDRQKFAEAAELFAFIVENFDERDAYAWEYLGYNLARAGGPASTAEARVLGAYERAHDLWRDNPLYHGRLLGFRGQLGQDITGEFAKWLDHYVRTFGEETDAVSFFAEAVFRGLWRGHQVRQRTKILKEKRAVLERFAPRVLSAKPEAVDGASPSEEQGSDASAAGWAATSGAPPSTDAPCIAASIDSGGQVQLFRGQPALLLH